MVEAKYEAWRIRMRIISGERRGHKLIEFLGDDVRPTTDRVKESIFNIIQNFIPMSLTLDLFAGSGALSFEALSRGAKEAVCVDIDDRSIDIIKRNAEDLKYSERCRIIKCSAFEYLLKASEKFDVIFLDPPYNKGLIEPVLNEIVKRNVLSDDGIIVLESDNTDFHGEIEGLFIYRQRKYGRTYITVYSRNEQ